MRRHILRIGIVSNRNSVADYDYDMIRAKQYVSSSHFSNV